MTSPWFRNMKEILFKSEPTTLLNLCENNEMAKRISNSAQFWKHIYFEEFPKSRRYDPQDTHLWSLDQDPETLKNFGPWMKKDKPIPERTNLDWKNMYIRDTNLYKINLIFEKHQYPFYVSLTENYIQLLKNILLVLSESRIFPNDKFSESDISTLLKYNIYFTFVLSESEFLKNSSEKNIQTDNKKFLNIIKNIYRDANINTSFKDFIDIHSPPLTLKLPNFPDSQNLKNILRLNGYFWDKPYKLFNSDTSIIIK